MLAHHCTVCDETYLIFDSQITSVMNTGHGIEIGFTCWCGAEQTELTGRYADRRTPDVVAA